MARAPKVKDLNDATPAERRHMVIEDRRVAVESVRDLAKWTMAALLTLNSGGAVITLSHVKTDPALATSMAGVFAMGAVLAILAGGLAVIAAFHAIGVAQEKLGLLPRSKWRLRTAVLTYYVTIALVVGAIGGSFWAFFKGVELHSMLATAEARNADEKSSMTGAK